MWQLLRRQARVVWVVRCVQAPRSCALPPAQLSVGAHTIGAGSATKAIAEAGSSDGSEERANDDRLDCLVRLWLIVEEDRGMGATVCSGHATESEAKAATQGSHEYVEWVDIPWSRIEALKPNARRDLRREETNG